MRNRCRLTRGLPGLVLGLALTAQAYLPADRARPTDVDRRWAVATSPVVNSGLAARGAGAAVAAQFALAGLRQRVPGLVVDFDPHFGTVASLRSTDAWLTPAQAPAAARSGSATGPEAEAVVHDFLDAWQPLLGHGSEALAGARLQQQFVGAHNGLRTLVWQQTRESLPIQGATLIAHVTARGELVSLASGLLPAALPDGPAQPVLSALAATTRAAEELGGTVEAAGAQWLEPPAGPAQRQRFTAPGLLGEASAELLWLPMNRDRLRLCWQVVFTPASNREMFLAFVDAASGEVIVRRCLTEYAVAASFRVFTSDSPTPLSPGNAAPVTNQPALAARELVTLVALSTNASPGGWIDAGVNETRGNNTDAHLDRNADNVPDTPRPQGVPARVFEPPLDLSQPPGAQGEAAVVQLFYTCNWMHDRLYELGFTEAAGNFQVNNFGRGGLGNDALQAQAQDGSGTDNANMSTPPDGTAPRMQMFLFTGPTPARDGSLDAEVVLHEYTHGLSNRRVGGGAGLTSLQSRGLGEGWSDWYALALLSAPTDDPDGVYACGAYVAHLLRPGFRQNYYFGVRRYPYTTDLGRNPLTFADIDPSQASSHPGVPFNPVFPASDASPAEVHNQGEVWCAMLWEVRASLVRKHGAAAGNQLALQLVTDALALTPANPTFIQARDAVLQADLVNEGGANRKEIWAAFAKRGLGVNAVAPASSTTTGVVESYDPPDDLRVATVGSWVGSGPVGGPFAPSSFSLTLSNLGANSLAWSLVNTSVWAAVSPVGGALLPGDPATDLRVALTPAAAGLGAGIHTATLGFSNHASQVTHTRMATLRVGLADSFTEQFSAADNDLDFQSFTFTPDGSPGFYSVCREAIASFPTAPTDGQRVALLLDTIATLPLTNGARVALYGSNYTALYVAAAGYLTFTLPLATNIVESVGTHFNRPRVSALFDDLDPTSLGSVYWQQLSNRAVVSFVNVPEYGRANSNSFQVEMFFDGRIRLSYLGVSALDGLVGLSAGLGAPAGFQESDFSGYGPCRPPLRLTLPAVTTEGSGVLPAAGRVELPRPAASEIVVQLRSSAPAEASVPEQLVIPAGATEASFDLAVGDDGLLDGSQVASVEASAPGFTAASAEILVHDNEQTTLRVVLPAGISEGAGVVGGQVVCDTAPDAPVRVSLQSSDLTELRVPGFVTVGAGQTSVGFAATAIEDSRIDGPQSVNVTPRVENWPAVPAAVAVLDNESLALNLTLPSVIVEDAGPLANAGRVALAGTLETNLVIALGHDQPQRLGLPVTVTVPVGQTVVWFGVTPLDNFLTEGDATVSVVAAAPGMESATNWVTVRDDDVAPQILAQPRSRTLYAGNSVTFAAGVFGQKPLAWQWYYNGLAIPGWTEAALRLTGLSTNQSGDYAVRVTNPLGQAMSEPATLKVRVLPPCVSLGTNLVSWWRGESNTWDSAGTAHAAAGGSNPLPYTAGKAGAAFNCLFSYYAVPAVVAPDLSTNAGLTIEGWIRPGSVDLAGNPICEWSPAVGTALGYGLAFGLAPSNGTHYLRADLWDVLGLPHVVAAAPGGFTNGVWSHVALSFDRASGLVRLFADGAIVAETNVGPLLPRTQGRLLLGGGTSLAALTPVLVSFRGAVDELSLYDRALEPEEIELAWAIGANGKCVPAPVCVPPPADLVAWWRGESNTLDSAGLNFLRVGSSVIGGTGASVNYQAGVAGAGFLLPSSTLPAILTAPAGTDLDLGAQDGMTVEGWFMVGALSPFRPVTVPLVRWLGSGLGWGTPGGTSLDLVGLTGTDLFAEMNFGGVTSPGPTVSGTNLPVQTGRWNHLAVTYDKVSGLAVIFLNGAVAGQANLREIEPQTQGSLTLQGGLASGVSGYSLGVDELSLYARALTAAEVRGLFRAGAAGKCPPVPQCAPPLGGLVGWWRGEENALDNAGDNHAAAGAPAYAPGIVGRAFSLNSAAGGLQVPASEELNVGAGAGLTLEGWVKPSAGTNAVPLFAWGNSHSPHGLAFSIIPSASAGRVELRCTDEAGAARIASATNGTVGPSTWQHLAVTYDRASGFAALYVNGRLQTRTNLGSFTAATMDDLHLGFHPASGVRFAGELDELAVFNRALSEGEIRVLVAAREAGRCLIPPSVTMPPSHTVGTVGSNAALSVVATGSERLRYQWRHDGVPIPDATLASLRLTGITPDAAGSYDVLVTNWFGAAVSSTALLSLNHPPIAGTLAAATFSNTPITLSLGKLLATASDPDGDALAVTAVESGSVQGGEVQLGLAGVAYQPALNFVGLGRFSYTVSDGRGGAALGSVEVGVRPGGGLSGNMLPAVTLAGGQVQVRFLGVPGRSYTVQRATAVPGEWTTLGRVQTSASGLGFLVDPMPPTGHAFYRTVHP